MCTGADPVLRHAEVQPGPGQRLHRRRGSAGRAEGRTQVKQAIYVHSPSLRYNSVRPL